MKSSRLFVQGKTANWTVADRSVWALRGTVVRVPKSSVEGQRLVRS